MGRQYIAGFYTQVRNDAFGGASTGALAAVNGAGLHTTVAGTNGRLDNSIVYTSPNWSGFTVVGGYGFGEVGTAQTGNNASQGTNGVITAGLNYANGPLNLDLAYASRQQRSTAILIAATAAQTGQRTSVGSAADGDSINEWMVGGSYDLKVVKLFATYQDQNDNNGTSATEASNRAWSVGATMPVFGNGTIRASYADLSWDRRGAGSSDVWALGYTHAMSKRTTLYTTYTYADNDRNALVAAGAVGNTKFMGESNGTFAAGINHSF
jgi:predicted porin